MVLLQHAVHWEQRSYLFQANVVVFELQVGRKECHGDGAKLDAATMDRARQTIW